MEEKSPFVVIFIVGILGVLFVLIFFIPLFFSTSFDFKTDVEINTNERVVTENVPVMYQYKNGIHTYKGELLLPTPCHALSARVVANDLSSDQVTLSFKSVSTGGVCKQIVTHQTFLVAFAANEEVVVDATMNGQQVNLDVTEIPSDQLFYDM